jgi:hypothetical protein
LARIV